MKHCPSGPPQLSSPTCTVPPYLPTSRDLKNLHIAYVASHLDLPKPHQNLSKTSATFPGLPGSAIEPPGAVQSSLDSPPEDPPAPRRSRARRPACLKTGPQRVLAAQSSQNHHKISSNRNRNASKTSCNLPRHLWKRHRASWSLSKVFLDSPPDSGLWTLDSLLKHAPYKR